MQTMALMVFALAFPYAAQAARRARRNQTRTGVLVAGQRRRTANRIAAIPPGGIAWVERGYPRSRRALGESSARERRLSARQQSRSMDSLFGFNDHPRSVALQAWFRGSWRIRRADLLPDHAWRLDRPD